MEKMQRGDLPSSHPPTSFKLIAAAPRSPGAYCQDKDKTSNNTILSPAPNHNDTHHSFMRHAVVYPPIRRRPQFRGGGGGSTCPTSTHPETEHHFNTSRRACHEPAWNWGETLHPHTLKKADRKPPRPRLHWLHSSRHSKSILGN
ncbi:Hypothetical protein FKW44_022004 [Caligus rogercresseyi]|uniref:Uncharacterized protein n=1 Tax=Caligus rogercresseyi TaxID=217165 RepID=A0A7T8JWA2_CALRO|nr:Hypothetical protein FKW44_022004 [Caligus rogercresseyi]